MYEFLIGVDLGQAQDYSAIVVIQRREVLEPIGMDPEDYHPEIHGDGPCLVNLYQLRHLERPPLGTSYVDVVSRVKTILAAPELQADCVTVVDATGCGRPVIDMMKRERISPLVAVTITGGATAIQQDDGGYHVPKRELVSALLMYLQSGRLKIAAALPDAAVLKQEILNFRVKISLKNGAETYEAWREHEHDDLVLATALPMWFASLHERKQRLEDLHRETAAESWDPLSWGMT